MRPHEGFRVLYHCPLLYFRFRAAFAIWGSFGFVRSFVCSFDLGGVGLVPVLYRRAVRTGGDRRAASLLLPRCARSGPSNFRHILTFLIYIRTCVRTYTPL